MYGLLRQEAWHKQSRVKFITAVQCCWALSKREKLMMSTAKAVSSQSVTASVALEMNSPEAKMFA